MPSLNELETLIDYAEYNPAIDTFAFHGATKSDKYWSSTTFYSTRSSAWHVDFNSGSISYTAKDTSLYVRAVRGGNPTVFSQPETTFTDPNTGLTWQIGTSSPLTWSEALAYCEAMELDNQTDWRLPSLNELETLIDYAEYNPAIDTTNFPGTTKSDEYWSSTTYFSAQNKAWYVDFNSGSISYTLKSEPHYFRAVRGGNPEIYTDITITLDSSALNPTYAKGDAVDIQWTSVKIDLLGSIRIAMKRDAVPDTQTEPDGVNWHRFTDYSPFSGSTLNDGSATVTIPPGIANASDWRFYVQHEESGVWDASDAVFTIGSPSSATLCFKGSNANQYPQIIFMLYAIDEQGNSLSLTKEDLTITENGQAITAFDLRLVSGNTYEIAYKTYQTDSDSLDIQINYNGSTSLDFTYTRNLPPVIWVPEGLISPQQPATGTGIDVHVFTRDSDGVKATYLKYKTSQGEWKTAEEISATGTKYVNYLFRIPGEDVDENPVEYYVLSVDEQDLSARMPADVEQNNVIGISFEILEAKQSYDEATLSMTVDLSLELPEDNPPSFSYRRIYSTSTDADLIPVDDDESKDVYLIDNGNATYQIVFTAESLVDDMTGVTITASIDALARETSVFPYNINVEGIIERYADTIILTDLSRMQNHFSGMSGDIDALKNEIAELVKATWRINDNGIPFADNNEEYNMLPVVVDLGNAAVFDNPNLAPFQLQMTESYSYSVEEAPTIVNMLTRLTRNFHVEDKYLVIVGGHEIIPFGKSVNAFLKIVDGVEEGRREDNWFRNSTTLGNITVGYEDIYSNGSGTDYYPSDRTYRKKFKTGRTIETPSHITSLIENYIQKNGYVLSDLQVQYAGGNDGYLIHPNLMPRGFHVTKSLRDHFAQMPEWGAEDIYYNPYGLSGQTVVNIFNDLSTGIIDLGGHGSYNKLNNSNGENRFWAQNHKYGNVLDITHSLQDFIIFSNACHTGYNFSSTETDYEAGKNGDFAEAYVNNAGGVSENRALSVFIAPTGYGKYS